MSIGIKKFTTIRMISKDVLKSRDWYKELFNTEPAEDLENFVSFKIAEIQFDITLFDNKNPFSTGGSVGYWLVDDVENVIEKVKMLGGTVFRGPLKVKETNRVIVQIKDPIGNIMGFESEIKNEV